MPKSAIALLRAKREMQANGTYTGDDSPTGSTDETMDTLAVMRERAERQNRSSPERYPEPLRAAAHAAYLTPRCLRVRSQPQSE